MKIPNSQNTLVVKKKTTLFDLAIHNHLRLLNQCIITDTKINRMEIKNDKEST